MPYKLFLEGQIIDLSDEVAATDDTLRNAFIPFFPELGTADIRRQEKDGITEIWMVKRAGTKGNAIMQSLIDSEIEINPTLNLTWQLKQLERSKALSIIVWELLIVIIQKKRLVLIALLLFLTLLLVA